MRYISAKEYADLHSMGVSTVYAKMKSQEIPWEWQDMRVMRIPITEEVKE